jgi:hypothetical protein
MGVCANARGHTSSGKGRINGLAAAARLWQLGCMAIGLAACVSTSIPEPAHGSPVAPGAEAAPVTPVATSLTSDPLATLPPAAQHESEHHHHREHAAPGVGGLAADGGGPTQAAPVSEQPPPPAADGGGRGVRAESEVYVCPMHPDVRQATPGTCPRCGMKLVPASKPVPAPKDPKQPHEHHAD